MIIKSWNVIGTFTLFYPIDFPHIQCVLTRNYLCSYSCSVLEISNSYITHLLGVLAPRVQWTFIRYMHTFHYYRESSYRTKAIACINEDLMLVSWNEQRCVLSSKISMLCTILHQPCVGWWKISFSFLRKFLYLICVAESKVI